jgi:hypothetical protein
VADLDESGQRRGQRARSRVRPGVDACPSSGRKRFPLELLLPEQRVPRGWWVLARDGDRPALLARQPEAEDVRSGSERDHRRKLPGQGIARLPAAYDEARVGRLVSLAVVLVFGLALAATASAGPRDEKERLTKADTALARHGLVRQSDLPGWTALNMPLSHGPRCRGYNPDFSRFTITGRAGSGFTHGAGTAIGSAVEVYASAAQATGDFAVGTRPAFLSCFSSKLARQFAKSGVAVSVASQRSSRLTGIGARALSWHIVFRLTVAGRSVRYYVDLYGFRVNRALGSVSFQSLGKPVPRQVALARLMATRLS